jgi:murein DD-endopeptidase MepM/ murein hydrolase activator NlpD
MAQKESRLAQILRQELKAGTNLPQALAMANVASLREKGDYRNLFPKSGVLGQVLRASLGKGYQYDRSVEKSSGGRGAAGNAAGALTAGATRLTARNTMVLPAMARDMNIIKQNLASLVRSSGKKAFTRPQNNYLSMGPKKPKPGASTGSSSSAGGDSTLSKLFSGAGFAASLASGIVSNIFSVMGSMLSFGGSLISGAVGILGSVLGGALNIGGGIVGGILGGLGSVVRGMGIFGIIALAGAGFLMYQISKNITGELSFDKIVNYIKESLGLDKGESFRDAMFRAFGFIDKKTGLNTQGAFVAVEREFVGWLAFSKSILSSVVDTVANIGQLAILEMKSAFLTYGTATISILSKAFGGVAGAQAGFDVSSLLLSLGMMMIPGGQGAGAAMGVRAIGGTILKRLMIGGGLLAGGTAAGAAGGYALGGAGGEAINKMIASNMLSDEQKQALKIFEDPAFLKMQGEYEAKFKELTEEQKREAVRGRPNVHDTNPRKSTIEQLKEKVNKLKEQLKPYHDKFEKAFGTDIQAYEKNPSAFSIEQAQLNLENQIAQRKAAIGTPAAILADANSAKQTAYDEYDDVNRTRTSPTRVSPLSNFKGRTITSEYGKRKNPVTGKMEMHGGIDITGEAGESIYSSIAGTVIKSGFGNINGNHVFIQGSDGTITKYLHLQEKSALNVGDIVTAGQVIGKLGSTGRSTGNHLHFEVAGADGKTIDPMPFLNNVTTAPPVVAVAPKPTATAADGKDPILDIISGQNKYDKMSESELLIEIMGDMFGDITKVLSGMMSNLSKGGPNLSDGGGSGADVLDLNGTQTTQALQGRLFYSMTG